MPLGGWGEGKTKRAGDYGKGKEKEIGSRLFPSSPARSFFFVVVLLLLLLLLLLFLFLTGGSLCGERYS